MLSVICSEMKVFHYLIWNKCLSLYFIPEFGCALVYLPLELRQLLYFLSYILALLCARMRNLSSRPACHWLYQFCMGIFANFRIAGALVKRTHSNIDQSVDQSMVHTDTSWLLVFRLDFPTTKILSAKSPLYLSQLLSRPYIRSRPQLCL